MAGTEEADVFVRLRRVAPALSKAERRIAEAAIADPAVVVDSTITRLAEVCDTSPATVARFCRSAGFGGYTEFRLAVASAASRDAAARDRFRIDDAEIAPTDSAVDVVTKVAYQESKAIEETARHLDLAALDAVVAALRGASRIHVYGAGASALAAEDMQQKLTRIGLPVWSTVDPHVALVGVAQSAAGDVAVAISHSGQTREACELLAIARERGATTVAITNVPDSAVGERADLVLATSARESRFRTGAMSSRSAQLAVVDFVMVRLLQGMYEVASDRLQRTFDAVAAHRMPVQRAGSRGRA